MGERVSASRVVIVDDAASMPALLGTGDSVLKEVEGAFPAVDVLVRGNHISLTGDDAAVSECAAAIEELRSLLAAGVPLTPDVARESIRMLQRARSAVAAARHGGAVSEPPSSSVAILSRSILSSRGRTIRPKTEGQAAYVHQIEQHTVTFGIGPAGTGKTYLAMAQAVAALQAKQVSRIILTRPAVEAGERLGFLPGTLSEKIDPYLRPLYDALHDMVDPESIPRLIEAGTIEVAPLAYMRGRTLNDAFIILDEAQNTTREQMKMFLTRLGFGSTMVVTGDITQVDLPGGTTSGLRAARDILRGIGDIGFSELTAQDVVRHRLVSDIITAYASDEAKRERQPREGQQRRYSRTSERHGAPHKETEA
ncbi:PhoH family protein [Demequina sp.]|uniref:PhoH family protein n=1 Tax=Demequina sp. TaxID=2050685 RepID=UPI0025B9DBC6|nr:PhoH family protein [Demequina sp.]